mmetsp:Transcript_5586/g.5025  ORF Transcript_5586/g.5025 Transcript_5586/m.5025 type:complete len:132 (+) Transcript_5586:48-443(+)
MKYIIIAVIFSALLALSHSFSFTTSKVQVNRNNLVMRERKCDITSARKNSKAMSVSKSNRHTHRTQEVNLQTKKLFWTEGNTFVRIRISTKTLKTIQKNGLHATATKYGIDLKKFAISGGVAPKVEEPVSA